MRFYKKNIKFQFIIFFLGIVGNQLMAQVDSLKSRPSFFEIAPTPNKPRIITVSTSLAASYTGAMLYLNEIWYAGTKKSKFHFFDDSEEWLQVDKSGHIFATYQESLILTNLMKWSGIKDKKSALIGSLIGFGFQTSIEVFDGFSEKWGASISDVGFNALGAGLAYTQFYFWNEQRIRLKYSFHEVTHDDSQLLQRSIDLYGANPLERIIKDYNGIVIWVSVNPSSFIKNSSEKAKWLNIALGYAGGGLYGGFENEWTDQNGKMIYRNDVERYRRFFLSLDVDWERIRTKSPVLKSIFSILNVIKVPFPSMEFNTKGEILFHPMLFLNWNKPIILKK